MKLKSASVVKECKHGDKYKFKNGVAIVPGFRIGGKEVKITIIEFKEMDK